MSPRPSLLCLCGSRSILALTLTLVLSSVAWSQQIPCPVTTPFSNSGTTAINATSPCNVNAPFTNNSGATLQNQPGGTIIVNAMFTNIGTLNNNGSIGIEFNPTGGNLTIANGGTLINSGTVNNNNGFPGSVLTISSGGMFTNNSGALLNNAFDMFVNGTLNNSGTFINDGILGDTGMTNNHGLYNNLGAIDGVGTLNNYGTLTNSGLINILPGDVLNNLSGSTYLQTSGQATTNVSGILNAVTGLQIQGGTLDGIGTINGNVTVGGTLAAGPPSLRSTGTLTINGNYTQTSAATFEAELAGIAAGLNYDQLVVNGKASLNGMLDVNFLNGFTATPGEDFILMTYNSETGTFSTLDLPALPTGENWLVTYGADDLTLSVGGAPAAPEPSALLLLGAGLLMVALFSRRNREPQSNIN